ncbi:unnamed protein product, partial [Didymodactylos carnosus]
ALGFMNVIEFLGPKLYMISKMLKDLAFFMCILLIVCTGYSVASRAVCLNGQIEFSGKGIFRQIFYPVYYMMYGIFDTDFQVLDESLHVDSLESASAHVLLAIHVMFVNVLLLNLLIAMFSNRFQQVEDETKIVWYNLRYTFVRMIPIEADCHKKWSAFEKTCTDHFAETQVTDRSIEHRENSSDT